MIKVNRKTMVLGKAQIAAVTVILTLVALVLLGAFNRPITIFEASGANDPVLAAKIALRRTQGTKDERAGPPRTSVERVQQLWEGIRGGDGFEPTKGGEQPPELDLRARNFLLASRDPFGNLALHWAVKEGAAEATKYLLSQATGADDRKGLVNTPNSAGSLPLHWAAHRVDNDKVIQMLVDAGADVNAKNKNGETPLHWAVEWVSPSSVRKVLTLGADARAQDNELNTPLHKVDKECHTKPACAEVVALMVKAGAEVTSKNKYGRTALQYFDTGYAPPPNLNDGADGAVRIEEQDAASPAVTAAAVAAAAAAAGSGGSSGGSVNAPTASLRVPPPERAVKRNEAKAKAAVAAAAAGAERREKEMSKPSTTSSAQSKRDEL